MYFSNSRPAMISLRINIFFGPKSQFIIWVFKSPGCKLLIVYIYIRMCPCLCVCACVLNSLFGQDIYLIIIIIRMIGPRSSLGVCTDVITPECS